MVMDLLNTILKDLEKHLKIEDLHSDKNESCLLHFSDDFQVQIELAPGGEYLCVGTSLGEIPSGRYRQTLFKEALRANGMPGPRYGTFAYSEKSRSLVLFEYLWAKEMTGEKLYTFLIKFKAKSLQWKDAIARGEVPLVGDAATGNVRPRGMFGL